MIFLNHSQRSKVWEAPWYFSERLTFFFCLCTIFFYFKLSIHFAYQPHFPLPPPSCSSPPPHTIHFSEKVRPFLHFFSSSTLNFISFLLTIHSYLTYLVSSSYSYMNIFLYSSISSIWKTVNRWQKTDEWKDFIYHIIAYQNCLILCII